jgi:hypothetical protein
MGAEMLAGMVAATASTATVSTAMANTATVKLAGERV